MKIKKYPIEDKNQIIYYRQHPAGLTMRDADIIYMLYKKYVNPNAGMYSISCNCNTNISAYANNLLDWFSQNENKFE